MKSALNLICIGAAAANIQPIADLTRPKELPVNRNGDSTIHRMLQGCRDDFRCPQNSERKPGRSCYNNFQDCECDPGYSKRGNACIAEMGLCSLEYIDMVKDKQDEVKSWINKVGRATDPEEKYRHLEKVNNVLSESWDDYNKGKASCEMYVFDDDRRKLRCCSRLRNGFKKLANGFKEVVKKVVDVVVEVVDIVVDVVIEFVECGVGIATDGVKCGVIGCAFGLFGVAADIAFTLATGGVNRAIAASCEIAGLDNDDDDDSDDCKTQQCRDEAKKRKKQNAKVKLLGGVGDAVCAINQKIESRVLGKVCDFSEEVLGSDELSNAGDVAELLIQNEVVLRFVEAFKKAMCGSPGSALTDILEEVVKCEIGCAKRGNVFCSNEKVDDNDGRVEYRKHIGQACRTNSGGRGDEGKDFALTRDISEEVCKKMCSGEDECKGWEYSRDRCETWKEKPARFADVSGFDCYVKLN